jgi:hypothetical protein
MPAEFECQAAAAILQSGRTMSAWANTGAIIAGVGLLYGARTVADALLCLSLAFWLAGNVFAVRVRIDEALFRALAYDPESGATELDRLLIEWKLIKSAVPWELKERYHGAFRLWRVQRSTLVAQLIVLSAALTLHLSNVRC